MNPVIRGPGGYAPLLVGDHAFPTLSLGSRSHVMASHDSFKSMRRQD